MRRRRLRVEWAKVRCLQLPHCGLGVLPPADICLLGLLCLLFDSDRRRIAWPAAGVIMHQLSRACRAQCSFASG